jgi:hypothetical protein
MNRLYDLPLASPQMVVSFCFEKKTSKGIQMNKSIVSRRSFAGRSSCGSLMIERLEERRLLSASSAVQILPLASSPLAQFKPVAPAKIMAGSTGTEQVTIRNPSAASETEEVTITLAPSLNGKTASGSYSSPAVSESLTIKAHGSAAVKVPFVPTATLPSGKYHTLVSVVLGTNTITGTAPGTYTLIVPPAPTTTPSLIGRYFGLITATSSSGGGIFGGGSHTVHQATFIWQTTGQTLSSLTGLFAVGSGQTNATMTGSEVTTGAIQYTLTSANINYTIAGKVTPDGSTITGTFKGTLVNNIFKKLNGRFKITLQTS